ncbi:hypothetical protein, variant [Aphanomyces invadans]|nr:hypothetical protein, variant [Aphanomyces invadans]ETW06338.1 hypothetical protein, variant [Aphanomyces invadans]|eukprot:XP_008864413.1 hypothetical protein, variant [Aphanomyces invadans]
MNESITLDALSALVKANADVRAVDADGNTALHSLCANPSVSDALLAIYLDRPAPLNAQNQFKATPLHYLCQNARVSPTMLKQLLDARADPNLPDNTGNTPLHALCDNAAVTVALLQVMLAHPSIDLLATNASGRRAAASLDTDECKLYVEQFSSVDSSLLPSTSSTVPGGEDVADLPEPLRSIMAEWNHSLPPFDEAFYTAVSCEPAFERLYSQVQNASVLVAEHPSDKTLLAQWSASMSEWRQTIVRAFLTLVNPRLWESYMKTFDRRVPDDVVKMQAKVEAIWTKFPQLSQRRERLGAVQELY